LFRVLTLSKSRLRSMGPRGDRGERAHCGSGVRGSAGVTEWCGSAGAAPGTARRCRVRRPIAGFDPTSQPPEARHVTNMRKRGPAAGAARPRRARAGRPPRAVARPRAAAEVRRDPSGACASYSTTSDFCVPCVFVQSTTSTALSSSRTAGRGELASAGWGAGRGREPGAARD